VKRPIVAVSGLGDEAAPSGKIAAWLLLAGFAGLLFWAMVSPPRLRLGR